MTQSENLSKLCGITIVENEVLELISKIDLKQKSKIQISC